MKTTDKVRFAPLNTLLAVFGTATFRIYLASFFWEKLFNEDGNILCNHIPLE